MAFEASIATIGTGMPIGRMGTAQADTNRAGSVTKRFLGIPVQSTNECKTREEEK